MYSRQFTQYILGFLFLVSSSFAFGNTEFTYNVIDGGIEVTGCVDACPSDLVIPEEIDGLSVTSIGPYAFSHNELTSLSLPENLEFIGRYAFQYNSLSAVTLPLDVTLSYGVFMQNYGMTNVKLPETATFINNLTFAFTSINTVNIPKAVTHIYGDAFLNSSLENLYIPKNVAFIDGEAFRNNPLTKIDFLGNRPSIDSDAFMFSDSLTHIFYCPNNTGWPGDAISIALLTNPLSSQNLLIEPDDTLCYWYWDFDKNDFFDALTDGLIFLRYSFNLRGDNLIDGTITPDNSITYQDIENSIGNTNNYLDIDENGSVDALSDALLLIRYAFGLRGEALVNGAISPNANRTSAADIETYIESHMP
jgi:hypothetical protein